jgi:Zn-dependent protease/CBS domain-containing protein
VSVPRPVARDGRRTSFSLGRIAGISVRLDWSLVFIFALLTWVLAVATLPEFVPGAPSGARWAAAAATSVLFLASLLVHELSHSVVARRRGVDVRDIKLWLLGGISTLEGEAPSARADLEIAIAGPLSSLALSIAFFVVAAVTWALGAPELVAALFLWLGSINLLLALFNLLPGAPLDGGRVLRAVLWMRRGDRRSAALSAARSGRTLGWVLVALGFLEFLSGGDVGGLWLMLIGWFVTNAAHAEEMQTVLTYDLGGLRVADVMTPNPVCAPAMLTVQQLLDNYVFVHRHSTFPLVDDDGRVRGLVTLSRVKTVPAPQRSTTLASAVAWPIDSVTTATPGEPIIDVLGRATNDADSRVLVFAGGTLVGIVSPSDIARTLQIAEARHPSPTRRAA